MGNCQAAEAATVVIQHPGNKIERIYWSVSAHEIMNSNPGHYVALVVTSRTMRTENGLPLKQLKLLRPDDTLLIGQVYRLISFEDVLKEFASKKCVKLGKLLKDRRGLGDATEMKKKDSGGLSLNPNPNPNPISKSENCSSVKVGQEVHRPGSNGGSTSSSRGAVGRHHGGGGQWKPALQSISEIGT
ncbi:hypothetical protein GH714_015819 [Hevea brasiliensis]|uniref:DUF4228 domain-containing protein n=1 Tax=Hevea brasiliensis TaxID=3981 RepID=A0A6A6L3K6_HEVBR|nr:hypothetical protein GH714_015819 [Hevea brasiliensis]